MNSYYLWILSFKPGEQPNNYSDEDDEVGSSDKSGGEDKQSDDKTEAANPKPEEWISQFFFYKICRAHYSTHINIC